MRTRSSDFELGTITTLSPIIGETQGSVLRGLRTLPVLKANFPRSASFRPRPDYQSQRIGRIGVNIVKASGGETVDRVFGWGRSNS